MTDNMNNNVRVALEKALSGWNAERLSQLAYWSSCYYEN